MSTPKPYFVIPPGTVLRPHGDASFEPGDEDALRTILTAEEITGYVDAGHLRATTKSELAGTTSGPAKAVATKS